MTDRGPVRGGPQYIPRPESSRPGPVPSWASADKFSMESITAALRAYRPSELVRGPAVNRAPDKGRRSAVLVAVYDGADGPTTILTRRPKHMRKHAGEVAFPGGAYDETDESLWHTALREAEEEIALDPSLPERVGDLDSFVTGASFSLVQPIVATLAEPPRLVASPDEVDVILHVPLAELLTSGVYRHEEWYWRDDWREMHFFELVGDTVWGATAFMLHNLFEIISGTATR